VPSDSVLIAPAAAARILGISVDTLRRWANEGKLESVRTLGNQRRFRRVDIEALAAGTTEAAAS
jgi:excisionase family DNA binding protein